MLNNADLLGRVFLRKPRFFSRTALNFARSTLLGQQRMRFMDIAVDYACNLSCVHCSALPLHRSDEPPLSVEEYGRIAGELRAAGVVLFHFTVSIVFLICRFNVNYIFVHIVFFHAMY